MTDAVPPGGQPATPALDPKIAAAFCRYAGGYWTGASARQAWLLTIGLATCLALSTAVTVALNHWNRWFFDSLEKKDVAAVWQAVGSLGLIIGTMAAIGVGIVMTRETLQVRWRQWLIDRLLRGWLGEKRFYHLNATRTEPANPEYRIADDTRWATEPLTDLGIGLVIAVLNATAFISILWTVGGSYTLSLGQSAITIPAYMVLVALAYGITMSLLMLWIGRPLPSLVYAKNEREGDFRFALMRLRENAESVALMGGHKGEQLLLGRMFDRAVAAWLLIVRRHGHVTWITNSSGPLIPIVPLLFAAPKYLSGELSLGQVTQLAGAFVAVQGAISWVVDNFNRIAEWYASARRVMDIVTACDEIDKTAEGAKPLIAYDADYAGGVQVERLAVNEPMGGPVVEGVSVTARGGESTYISGGTNTGKSTVVRAIAGLWRNGDGKVRLPENAHVMVVPQKPYMPLGTLAEIMRYPSGDGTISDSRIRAALEGVGLAHLGGQLGETVRWDQRLSNGERQRLALARALLHQPDVLLLDDALTALDLSQQTTLMSALKAGLPMTAIVVLGQAAPPGGMHDRTVTLGSGGVPKPQSVRANEPA